MQAQTAQRVTWFSQIGGPAFEEPRESQCVSDHTPPSSAVVTDT